MNINPTTSRTTRTRTQKVRILKKFKRTHPDIRRTWPILIRNGEAVIVKRAIMVEFS